MSITTMDALEVVPEGTTIRTDQGRWVRKGDVFTRRGGFEVPLSYFADAVTTGISIVDDAAHLGVGELVTDVGDLEDLPAGTVIIAPSAGYWTKSATHDEQWVYRDGTTRYTTATLMANYTGLKVVELPAPPMQEDDVLTKPEQFAGLKVGSVVSAEGGSYTKAGPNLWVRGSSRLTDEEMTRFDSDVTLVTMTRFAVGDHMSSLERYRNLPPRSVVTAGATSWRKQGELFYRTSDHRASTADNMSRTSGEVTVTEVGAPRTDGLPEEGTVITRNSEEFRALPTGTFFHEPDYGLNLVKVGEDLYDMAGAEVTRDSRLRIMSYVAAHEPEPEPVPVPFATRVADALNEVLASHPNEPEFRRDLLAAMENLGLPHDQSNMVVYAVTVTVHGTTRLEQGMLALAVGPVERAATESVEWDTTLRIPRQVEADVCACDLVSRADIEHALSAQGVTWSEFDHDYHCESGACNYGYG